MRETPHFGLDMKVICKHSASQWSCAIQATDEFYSAGRARFRFQYGKLVWKPSKPIRVIKNISGSFLYEKRLDFKGNFSG